MVDRVRNKKEERIVPREKDYAVATTSFSITRFTYLRVNSTMMGIKHLPAMNRMTNIASIMSEINVLARMDDR